jgi:hypothetical protein
MGWRLRRWGARHLTRAPLTPSPLPPVPNGSFFRRSGLPKEVLARVWDMASTARWAGPARGGGGGGRVRRGGRGVPEAGK